MTYTTTLDDTEVDYTIRIHPRARRTKLTIYPDGRLVATIPPFATEKAALRLIKTKRSWILRHLTSLEKELRQSIPFVSKRDIPEYKRNARIFIEYRLAHFNAHYNFAYNRMYVKDMKSQWGSCSHKKNLNYNFRLLLVPEELADTVIVHELCHLKEMNHSRAFWSLVGETISGYRKKERALHQYLIQ